MRFTIIGIDDNQIQYFDDNICSIISRNTTFSGGKRHYEIVRQHLPLSHSWIAISVPLDAVFEQYKLHEDIVVFASGDPLFNGFANTILRKLPTAEIELFPSFNSLQMLAHRMLLPYQDMHNVSLTGRSWHKFDEALITGYEIIGVLTDRKLHTPATIADRMLHYGFTNYTMTVGELLGNREYEKFTTLKLEEVASVDFAYPNNIILRRTHLLPRPFGISEKDFHLLNGRTKMITKMPVRLLSLSMLNLRECSVFWDIGFCTGSVSIEAKMQFPHLRVISFEIRSEGKELMESNSRKFHTPGIHTVIGDFTEQDLDALPQPDAVFIGGHGGKLDRVINLIDRCLQSNGAIVFNSVLQKTLETFGSSAKKYNFHIDKEIKIQIDDFNQITVLRAIRNNAGIDE